MPLESLSAITIHTVILPQFANISTSASEKRTYNLLLTTSMMKLFIIAISISAVSTAAAENQIQYGTDISFPMHADHVSTNYAWLPHNVDPSIPTPKQYQGMPIQPLGDMQAKYDKYMQGCVDFYNKKGKNKGKRCWDTESDRLSMSLRQPKSVYNYTKMGFTKIRAPDVVFNLLKEFWNKNHGKEKGEQWAVGNIYT